MKPETQESIDFLQGRTQWQFTDIQELDEGIWVARATTTHFAAYGEAERSFGIMVSNYNHIMFPLDALPVMATWCQKQGE